MRIVKCIRLVNWLHKDLELFDKWNRDISISEDLIVTFRADLEATYAIHRDLVGKLRARACPDSASVVAPTLRLRDTVEGNVGSLSFGFADLLEVLEDDEVTPEERRPSETRKAELETWLVAHTMFA